MVKKLLIVFIVTIVSFAATFGAVWFANSKQDVTPQVSAQAQQAGTNPMTSIGGNTEPVKKLELYNTETARSLPERRLQNLIEDARNKVRDVKTREDQLDEYEKQLEMTRESLSGDIERLSQLYEQLSRQILTLKQQKQMLDSRIVEIKQDESERLKQLAAVYDNMDEQSSANLFINMISNSQLDDAAKIVFFMSERKSAKVLAEITNKEPTIARVLCSKIKSIKEES